MENFFNSFFEGLGKGLGDMFNAGRKIVTGGNAADQKNADGLREKLNEPKIGDSLTIGAPSPGGLIGSLPAIILIGLIALVFFGKK